MNIYDGNFYFAIFDKRYKKGEKLCRQFKQSHVGNNYYRWQPTPAFERRGQLVLEGAVEELGWVVLKLDVAA
jgi:hypothetical protein